MAALAMASVLLTAPGAMAQSADTMTIKDFRARNEQAQTYMVLGFIALTAKLEIVCPQQVSVGEWRAALQYRPVSEQRPWVDVLLELMDERGCKGETVKADL